MTLPTQQQDVWTLATLDDKLKALTLLARLPAGEVDPDRVEIDRAAMYLALDGVTRYGLGEAVKAVLQGALGHEFFPTPVALRQQCDKAMEHHVRMRDRILHREKLEQERPAERAPLTPEQRARQEERMRQFHASLETTEASELARKEAAELAERRIRYGMTDEALAAIPDRPLTKTWNKVA